MSAALGSHVPLSPCWVTANPVYALLVQQDLRTIGNCGKGRLAAPWAELHQRRALCGIKYPDLMVSPRSNIPQPSMSPAFLPFLSQLSSLLRVTCQPLQGKMRTWKSAQSLGLELADLVNPFLRLFSHSGGRISDPMWTHLEGS